jgi:hypothetical protein
MTKDAVVDDHACGRVVGELGIELETELAEDPMEAFRSLTGRFTKINRIVVSSPERPPRTLAGDPGQMVVAYGPTAERQLIGGRSPAAAVPATSAVRFAAKVAAPLERIAQATGP